MKKKFLSKTIFVLKTIVVLILLFITFLFMHSLYISSDLSLKDVKSKHLCNNTKELLLINLAKNDFIKDNNFDYLDNIKVNCKDIVKSCSTDILFNVESYPKEYFYSSIFLIESCQELNAEDN